MRAQLELGQGGSSVGAGVRFTSCIPSQAKVYYEIQLAF